MNEKYGVIYNHYFDEFGEYLKLIKVNVIGVLSRKLGINIIGEKVIHIQSLFWCIGCSTYV